MRFGKKLALQVSLDESGAPYLSHNDLKEIMNEIMKSIRSVVKPPEGGWPSNDSVSQKITHLDAQFFSIMDSDLQLIMSYIMAVQNNLEQKLAFLQQKAVEIGILFDEESMEQFESSLPWMSNQLSRTDVSKKILEVRFESDLSASAKSIAWFVNLLNGFVENQVDIHMRYIEINVAGFRKLLKRREKQVPKHYHALRTPYLKFHELVTPISQKLLKSTRVMCQITQDAQQRLLASAGNKGISDLNDVVSTWVVQPKSLGNECQMVLELQKEIRVSVKQNRNSREMLNQRSHGKLSWDLSNLGTHTTGGTHTSKSSASSSSKVGGSSNVGRTGSMHSAGVEPQKFPGQGHGQGGHEPNYGSDVVFGGTSQHPAMHAWCMTGYPVAMNAMSGSMAACIPSNSPPGWDPFSAQALFASSAPGAAVDLNDNHYRHGNAKEIVSQSQCWETGR